MGCVNSRTNFFQVMNVNDQHKPIARGCLEITDIDIIFHQDGKQPTKWPLRCLRRYGFDSEIFSFESGRRCHTGEGIYAFKCKKARNLFNLVQIKVQVCANISSSLILIFFIYILQKIYLSFINRCLKIERMRYQETFQSHHILLQQCQG